MKTNFLKLLVLLTLVSFQGYGQCWEQTWSDEFDGTSLNESKWDYDLGDGCAIGNCGWGNNELEYYTNGSNNITVAGGQLAITAKYQPNYNGSGKNYTSARLVTRGKYSQQYGRYEARIKVPNAAGVWPAFWTLGDNISTVGWPKCGEIDIMETQNAATKLWETVHYAGRRGAHAQKGTTFDYTAGLSNDFHVYAIEWDTNEIRWYFDGELKFTATKADITSGGGTWAFDQTFHILLNVAVGGNFAGSGNVVSSQYNDPANPVSMVVDYVRIYQLGACAPTPYVNITSPANNSTFNGGTNIDITADASFITGIVSKVEFFENNNKIGVDSTSPYSLSWSGASVGSHSLTAVATEAQGAIITSSPVAVTVIPPQLPFNGTPSVIPGRIEVENYDTGGKGIAYDDNTTGNSGGVFRSDDVDIETSTDIDGNYEVYNTITGEWLEYTVNVQTAGNYRVDVRLLSSTKKYNVSVYLDGQKLGAVTNTKPNGSANWQTVSFTTTSAITAGQKVLKISIDMDGVKLNYVNFAFNGAKSASLMSVDGEATMNVLNVYPNPTDNSSLIKLNVADATNAEYSVINSMGMEISRGTLSNDLEGKVNLAGMESGIYVVKVMANGKVYIEKLVKE